MEIGSSLHLWQVVTITLIGGLTGVASVLDEWQWHRPIIACTLIGLVLHNVSIGLHVGGVLELVALGWMNIGASQSPDTALASVLATILAIRGGNNASDAIALAVPIAVAGNLSTVLVRTLTVYIQHLGDRIALSSSPYYLKFLNYLALSFQGLRVMVPTFLFVVFVNRQMIVDLFHSLPAVLVGGFTAASGFIVVVGYAMVIRLLQANKLMPYFLLGFLAADFTKITLVGVGLVAISLALLHVRVWSANNLSVEAPQSSRTENEDAKARALTIPRRVMWKVFLRSQMLQASWNYERMQSMGYAYILEPALDHLFTDTDERLKRKLRHLEFYNTNPFVSNVVTGINVALEERLQATRDESYDRLVTSIKLGMMGPLAGIGDSIYWGTLRPLLASVSATFALRGSVLGPLLFFFSWNAIRLSSLGGLLWYGYWLGTRIVDIIATGVLRQVTEIATIVGLVVMGALVANWTHINFAIHWYTGHGHVTTLNHVVTQILPELPALLLVFAVMWLLQRGWGSVRVILILFVTAIIGVWVHVLSP